MHGALQLAQVGVDVDCDVEIEQATRPAGSAAGKPSALATASHRARARNCTWPTELQVRFCQNFRSGSRCGITHCARCCSKCNFEHKCTPHSRRSRTTSVLIHLEQFIIIIISKVLGSSNTRKRHFTFVQSSAAPCLLLAAVLLSAPSTHPVRVQ